MGKKFKIWQMRSSRVVEPQNLSDLGEVLLANRAFETVDRLEYGDHGLQSTLQAMRDAIRDGKRIALYADYDVDGTMSCVSWIWFFKAIGFENYVHYIPCRFKEGYGLNLDAMKHLIDGEGAEVIITMDTGITANAEAAYCKERGVVFICTDHHQIQPHSMPDCLILNPKLHPDIRYQELCGCGITFVLLRQLGKHFSIPPNTWTDILALTGMATICDLVPLNGVNHRLAKMGVEALMRSQRPVLAKLRQACAVEGGLDEKDVGFRLGPRINAVGRLEHADAVVAAFVEEQPDMLIHYMAECNEKRKSLQRSIVSQAIEQAQNFRHDPVLFLGGDWHQGVVGIAASKLVEQYWRPTWLFERGPSLCKGSARSIPGVDVTAAMVEHKELFLKCGGHAAAGGFSFLPEREEDLREALNSYAYDLRQKQPDLWQSRIDYDCDLPAAFVDLSLAEHLERLKPFGMGFEEPRFRVAAKVLDIVYYKDKQTGEPRHTAVQVDLHGRRARVMYFNEVLGDLRVQSEHEFLVSISRSVYRGRMQLNLHGHDYSA